MYGHGCTVMEELQKNYNANPCGHEKLTSCVTKDVMERWISHGGPWGLCSNACKRVLLMTLLSPRLPLSGRSCVSSCSGGTGDAARTAAMSATTDEEVEVEAATPVGGEAEEAMIAGGGTGSGMGEGAGGTASPPQNAGAIM